MTTIERQNNFKKGNKSCGILRMSKSNQENSS